MKKKYPIKLKWKCHTPNLLNDIVANLRPEGIGILKMPLSIFSRMLAEVATRASEINDPELNALMCRMTLYEIADPESKEYDPKLLNKTLKKGEPLKC